MNQSLPLLQSDKEVRYHRNQFQETLRVHGVGAWYHPIKRKNTEDSYDFYGDYEEHEIAYEKPIWIRILFQAFPQPKTLRSLGWYVEDEELPHIAYIPTEYETDYGFNNYIIPVVDDKIVLEEYVTDWFEGPQQQYQRSKRTYIVKSLRSQGYPNPIYHIAKLVPHYESHDDEYNINI